MADEAMTQPGGDTALTPPRPAPRTTVKPAPPPRHHTTQISTIEPNAQRPTQTNDTQRTYRPMLTNDAPYSSLPPINITRRSDDYSTVDNSKALVPREFAPPVRLIRPSEHLAMIDRATVLRNMDIYGVDPVSTVMPLHRRPPERMMSPQHLVPSVRILEPGRHRMPIPIQKYRPQIPRMITGIPRMPVPFQRPIMQKDKQVLVQCPPPLPAPAAIPAGLFGAVPRTIVIHRPDAKHGFGFTLRHLVVYPPESLSELYDDGRHLAVGVLGAPMDTIFVRSVRPGGPAALAGLRAGDRLVAVNGEPVLCGGPARAPYARVVQLAQREPHTLRLTVVPREADVLQRYFSEAAYNPETNQKSQVKHPQVGLNIPAQIEMPAPTLTLERESRLFDAYRRPRVNALPAPPIGRDDEIPEYASVASLSSSSSVPRCGPQIARDRRESDGSLPSSVTESNSYGSYETGSTMIGRELDDSVILSRIRKSLEQKEEFLRRPSQPTGWLTPEGTKIKPKEFYARPQKLQKTQWPPTASSPPPASTRIENADDAKKESDECSASVDSGTFSAHGELNGTNGQSDTKTKQKTERSGFAVTLTKIQETAASSGDSLGSLSNGSPVTTDDASHDGNLDAGGAWVRARAADWVADGAAAAAARTALYRSELTRLSTRPSNQPSVAIRRREFERRSDRREARSLDAATQLQATDVDTILSETISGGNRTLITGSKHLHCPPPDDYVQEEAKVQMRHRSNSTGSDGLPIRRNHSADSSWWRRRCGVSLEPARRPTQLSLSPPPSPSSPHTPLTPATPLTPTSGVSSDDTSTVPRRQKKESQLGEEERAMRRVSYLKATWGDRLHDNTELNTLPRRWKPPRFTNDITPLRRLFEELHYLQSRGDKKILPAADADMDAEKMISMQGNVQVKMVVNNGKKASDRSWKPVWAVLHGTKLYLYRQHGNQSPSGGSGSGSGGGGAGSGGGASSDTIDVRYSISVVAEDYTKRKHVLRVTTPTGAELLLQAPVASEAANWLKALKQHSVDPQPDWSAQEPQAPLRSKKTTSNNRSPSTVPVLPSSPKNKTWKGKMARQFRRMQGNPPATATPAASGWLGAPLERCPTEPSRPGVPLAVSLCAAAVEECGLRTVGVYRVPGNAAGVTALASALERGTLPASDDARWADVHVVSSLLKKYLRRLPDALLTGELYPLLIAADRTTDRFRELRRLIRKLPFAHYETLKFLMEHLRRVADHSQYNKMDARNLALMFGPTLVRPASDDTLALVNDMSNQCRIIESLIVNYEWYFDEDERSEPDLEPVEDDLAPSSENKKILMSQFKKIEARDVSSRRDIVTSIISAANRKIQRKSRISKSASAVVSSSCDSTDSSLTGKKTTDDVRRDSSPPHNELASLDQNVQDTVKRLDLENMPMNRRSDVASGKRIKTSTASLTGFAIDGPGDLVTSLTSTFDQKWRSLNGPSPLDDNSIPYADDSASDSEKENVRRRVLRSESLNWRHTRSAKLKRKNGMPSRDIKRRHTVGGTRDLPDACRAAAASRASSRASSPDLSRDCRAALQTNGLTSTAPRPLESHV